jgi:hypothetical protein
LGVLSEQAERVTRGVPLDDPAGRGRRVPGDAGQFDGPTVGPHGVEREVAQGDRVVGGDGVQVLPGQQP